MRKSISKIALAAGITLASAFTLSCSGGDDDGGGSGGYYATSCSGGPVAIGTQTWQKCNSNIKPKTGSSWCYEGRDYAQLELGDITAAEGCAKYGRLYNWEAAKSACPSGFHLPTKEEWDILIDYAGGAEIAGKKLKATSGWSSLGGGGNGDDTHGFSALPGGSRMIDGYLPSGFGNFNNAGAQGTWWSVTESSASLAYFLETVVTNGAGVSLWANDKSLGFSVRCIKD